MNIYQKIAYGKGINVLSLFGGIECGAVALQNLGIPINYYGSSEIDRYPRGIATANHPYITHLGDVRDIKGSDLPQIDLMFCGSPCQDLSFAKSDGRGLDGEKSSLFYEFVRLLDEVKPTFFLFENVRMKQEYQKIIEEKLGVKLFLVNSSLVSAQNRLRLYGTNIEQHGLPKDEKIVLKDILEDVPYEEIPQYLLNTWGDTQRGELVRSSEDEKARCLTATMWKGQVPSYVKTPIHVGDMKETVKIRKHEVDVKNLQTLLRDAKKSSKKTNLQIAEEMDVPMTKVEHWFRTDNCFAIPTDDLWFKLKDVLKIEDTSFDKSIMEFEFKEGVYESSQRVYNENGKYPTLMASNSSKFIETTSDKPIQVGKATNIKGFDIIKRVYHPNGKSPTLTTMGGGHREPKVAISGGAIRGRYKIDGVRQDHKMSVKGLAQQQLEIRVDEKTNCLTTVQKDNVLVDTTHWLYRKLTPTECESLQTLPRDYTKWGVFRDDKNYDPTLHEHLQRKEMSKTRRFKAIGNGWTVKVIEHLLGDLVIKAEEIKLKEVV